MGYERERETVIRAVTAAAKLAAEVQDAVRSRRAVTKSDASPVTLADFAAQAVINTLLLRAFPADPIAAEEHSGTIAEEDRDLCEAILAHGRAALPDAADRELLAALDRSQHPGGRDRFWTVDPIDGTKGFLRGEQYVVAIALLEAGEVVLGALACPGLRLDPLDPTSPTGCVMLAVKGEGATIRALRGEDEQPIRVSDVADPREAIICEPVERGHASADKAAEIALRLGTTRPSLRLDSQAKYGIVARGEASVYLRFPSRTPYAAKIWDHAAGALLVAEAGGAVSDIHGAPLDFSRGRTLARNDGIVATNGRLHEAVLAAARASLPM